jgi:hypothetical protein
VLSTVYWEDDMTSIVESTTAAGGVIEIAPAAAGPSADVPPLAAELCPDRNLGLRTTHERQRLLRQKALGWN